MSHEFTAESVIAWQSKNTSCWLAGYELAKAAKGTLAGFAGPYSQHSENFTGNKAPQCPVYSRFHSTQSTTNAHITEQSVDPSTDLVPMQAALV
jgi:hypothetical protein